MVSKKKLSYSEITGNADDFSTAISNTHRQIHSHIIKSPLY